MGQALSVILDWSGWILGFIGVLVSVYYGRKAQKIQRLLQSLSWQEIDQATSHLASQIKKLDNCDSFVSFDSRGGLISHMLKTKLGLSVPIFIGIVNKSGDGNPSSYEGYVEFKTPKWCFFLPHAAVNCSHKKVLLVDDISLTGSSLCEVKRLLQVACPDKTILTMSILASEISVKQSVAPDFFWKQTPYVDVTFPWPKIS